MRFAYILESDLSISIEIQRDIDKLQPFTRSKGVVRDLSNILTRDSDKIIHQFVQLLSQTHAPFQIHNGLLSNHLINLVNTSQLIFSRKNVKASLKRLSEIPLNHDREFRFIRPVCLEIQIVKFFDNEVCVEYFLRFEETPHLVPYDYPFLIPILDNTDLALVLDDSKEVFVCEFEKIANQSIDENRLSISHLSDLNKSDLITVKYYCESSRCIKNIKFSSDTLYSLKVFNDVNMSDEKLAILSNILINYVNNKNLVEYDDTVLVIDKMNDVQKIDNKLVLQTFSKNLNSDAKDFITQITNLQNLVSEEMVTSRLSLLPYIAKLKDYQLEGIRWLLNLHTNKVSGALLADEMGLGKTLQVITFLLLTQSQKILIITPASLTRHWSNELMKFTNVFDNDISFEVNSTKRITIVSYELARASIGEVAKKTYDILVLDESQKIKNQNTQLFNAIGMIRRAFTVIMTGTPVENSLDDLWNMLSTVNNGLHELYSTNIKKTFNSKSYSNTKAVELSIQMLYPIILQRTKKEKLNLPNKNVKTTFVDMSIKERNSYCKLVDIFNSAFQSSISGRIPSIALEGLLRLRQYCSIHSIIPENLLGTNDLSDSKVEAIANLLKENYAKREKTIIFSQFTKSLDFLEQTIEKLEYKYCRLDGSVSQKKRHEDVEKFQSSDSILVYLISLKAGGTGLNLTSAKHAILLEPWWNPAVEEQAFARIHRIGQKSHVTIHRLLYRNSIEEKMNNLLDMKKEVSDMLSTSLNSSYEMEIASQVFSGFHI